MVEELLSKKELKLIQDALKTYYRRVVINLDTGLLLTGIQGKLSRVIEQLEDNQTIKMVRRK